MEDRILMKGNHAVGEGGIQAGCQAYFGYPITPQNELTQYMAKRMIEEGRVFIQAESEIAAINMVFGASLAGARAMTSSSSPGISLKQEGISYMVGCELPGVIVNIQRGGPGLGNIAGAQSDYFQATRGGGHGDYYLIVLAPASVQEMYDLTGEAFDLADKYRNPVIVLADGILGQMLEPVKIGNKEAKSNFVVKKDWILDGCKGREPRLVRSLLMDEGVLEEHNLKLNKKYERMKKTEVRVETDCLQDAEVALVSYGTSARICKEAMNAARRKGIKVGLVRPITLWPFPEKVIAENVDKLRAFLVIEMSLG
ncbi:3-methyl-2-oxobutanoate dehydrogenase subunit VorB, partial [bacterium]|nr:3-methyl-2-oxobutanoate dehydrogenase subunit VorB [bacterium]NIN92248.1 3-methyl-2-oxobutanoate dehydrogenase subunit VorB [bacterium]NIO18387.1 3-methyl-2-oxobutanoate dehydrogenase subunit VorB [bacterium]NIO73366.1 3-methyl-2-oxobutanoate dehydrogenase subunit VorB [bacterium]